MQYMQEIPWNNSRFLYIPIIMICFPLYRPLPQTVLFNLIKS